MERKAISNYANQSIDLLETAFSFWQFLLWRDFLRGMSSDLFDFSDLLRFFLLSRSYWDDRAFDCLLWRLISWSNERALGLGRWAACYWETAAYMLHTTI